MFAKSYTKFGYVKNLSSLLRNSQVKRDGSTISILENMMNKHSELTDANKRILNKIKSLSNSLAEEQHSSRPLEQRRTLNSVLVDNNILVVPRKSGSSLNRVDNKKKRILKKELIASSNVLKCKPKSVLEWNPILGRKPKKPQINTPKASESAKEKVPLKNSKAQLEDMKQLKKYMKDLENNRKLLANNNHVIRQRYAFGTDPDMLKMK